MDTGENYRSLSKFLSSVYIADGLDEDMEELVKRCLQSDMLSYHVFCNIWNDMYMSAMYQGRSSGAELAELSEEAIMIAKRYMIRVCENFEESVAGLFLVYAIVRLQPYARFASLRITPEDIEAIKYLEQKARKLKRYDVLYILGSLLIEGPCEFHFSARDYGLEIMVRKYFDASSSVNKVGVRPRGVFHHRNEELDLMRSISSFTNKYWQCKSTICDKSDEKMLGDMNYFKAHTVINLGSSLRNLINGDVDLLKAAPAASHNELSKRLQIKSRAMKDIVQPIGHLTGLYERKQSPNKTNKKQSPKQSEIKTKQGKISSGSPKKKTATSVEKTIESKRMNFIKYQKPRFPRVRRRKIHLSDDDSQSDDDELVIIDDDSDLDVSTEKESELEDFDYDLQTIEKPNVKKGKVKRKKTSPKKKSVSQATRKKTAPASMDQMQQKIAQRKNTQNVSPTKVANERTKIASKSYSPKKKKMKVEKGVNKTSLDKNSTKSNNVNKDTSSSNSKVGKESFRNNNTKQATPPKTYVIKREKATSPSKRNISKSPQKSHDLVEIEIDTSTAVNVEKNNTPTNTLAKSRLRTRRHVK